MLRVVFKSLFSKFAVILTLQAFFLQQIAWANPQLQLSDFLIPAEKQQDRTSDDKVAWTQGESSEITSIDFLQKQEALQSVLRPYERMNPEEKNEDEAVSFPIYESERYDFEEAFDLLRPEYAAAAIVKSLSEDNIRQLLTLEFEVAIVILAGEIVLLSSGNENEIRTSRPASRLLNSAAFTAHTHPLETHSAEPSQIDIKNATGREYVLSPHAVYAYDRFDLEKIDLKVFFNEFEQVLKKERERYKENSVMARLQLNRFIKEMDDLNSSYIETDIFRASDPQPLNFNDFTIHSVPQQDLNPQQFQILDDGSTLRMYGNNWKALKVDAVVSADTALSFDFRSSGSVGELGAIAFSPNLDFNQSRSRTVLLYGTQTDWAPYQIPYTNTGNWQRLEIPIGSLFTGSFPYLFFINDADAGQSTDIQFKNVSIGVPSSSVPAPTVNALPLYTNQTTVTLNGTKQAGTSIWINGVERVSTDASTIWSYDASLSAEGPNSFSVTTKDASGNSSSSVEVFTTYDSTLPMGSIALNGGAEYVSSTTVSAALTANDVLSGVDQVRYQVNGVWTDWEAFSASKSLSLPAGDGLKTILYEIKDKAGNIYQMGDTIVLDTTPPELEILLNEGNAYTKDVSVTVALTSSDEGSGVNQMRYQVAGGEWSAWESYTPSKQVTLPSGDGNKEVRFEVRDLLGNTASAVSDIILDTRPSHLSTDSVYFNPVSSAEGLRGRWSFDEISANKVLDQGSFQNNGTLSGDPLINPSVPTVNYVNSGSLRFDGVNDSVNMGNSSALGSTRYSVAFWVNVDTSLTADGGRIVSRRGTGDWSQTNYLITVSRTSGKITITHVQADNAVKSATSATDFRGGGWHFVTATYDGAFIRVYVNGVEEGRVAAANPDISGIQSLMIGRSQLGSETFFFKGSLDDLQVYNRALTPEEVQTLAGGNNLGQLPVLTTDTVTVNYTVDGTARSKTFTGLVNGQNELRITEIDAAGNVSELVGYVTVELPENLVEVPTVNNVPAYTNQNTLTLSGTKQVGTSIWINGVERIPADASTVWSYDASLSAEELNSFSVTAKDALGNSSSSVEVFTTSDPTLPMGSIALNGGAEYVSSTTVSAALTANDVLSGVDQVRYQVNGVWTDWEAFSASKNLSLPAGDGLKTILYEIKDKAGNIFQVGDTIVLDTTPPELEILLNEGNAYTKDVSVTVALTSSDEGSGVNQMRYQVAGGEWSAWESYTSSKQITLPSGDGNKEVRFEVKDLLENTASAVSNIILDTTFPIISTDSTFFQNQTAETGLIGYWSFDEVTGTTVEDSSDNSNHGILVNGTATSESYPPLTQNNDGGLLFDGANDYVTTSNKVPAPQEFTVSLWFQATGAGGRLIGFGNKQTGYSTVMDRHVFMGNWGHLYFSVHSPSGAIQMIQTPQGYNDGQWHHLTASMSSEGMKLYVDGQLKAQNTVSLAKGYEGYWRLGGDDLYSWWNRPHNYYFKGQMDEPRIYSRQLSIEEIQTLALGGVLGTAVEPPVITTDSLTVSYSVDGVSKSKTFSGLVNGENELRITEIDAAGNESVLIGKVHAEIEDPVILDGLITLVDGTQLFYDAGTLIREVIPMGAEVFYRADGSIEKYRFLNGQEIHYTLGSSTALLFYDEFGILTESIERPQILPQRESHWLRVGLEGGLTAFYEGELLRELLTETGIRITGITFHEDGSILNGTIYYPDGSVDLIRNSKRIRRLESDGALLDFLPSGLAVREIYLDRTDYYRYEKLSQQEILTTRVVSTLGSIIVYDSKGILSEVHQDGSALFYDRHAQASGYRIVLDRTRSSEIDAKSFVEGSFSPEGVIENITLQDGTRIEYVEGRVSRVTDPSGEVINYDFELVNDFAAGLTVTRGGASFEYDQDGFLKKIDTASGTITRTAVDTDGDGTLTDEQIVELLLDEVGGNRLTDFELDSDGNILNGIIQTKEGIRQRIENGVLTGYETVDGKFYQLTEGADGVRRANLKEWAFRDGTRVIFDGSGISEILFPDGKRLHSIGLNSDKKLETVVEEQADGTQRFFEKGRLVKLRTPAGAEVFYDSLGVAEKIILEDSEEKISYLRDSEGLIQEIVFTNGYTRRSFRPDGTLLRILTSGVHAEMENDAISRLFTRFGEIESPAFNEQGVMSGDVQFLDGARLTIEDSELVRTVRPNGTVVNYIEGRVESIEIGANVYTFSYFKNSEDELTEVKIHKEENGVMRWEFPLIPLLQNPAQFLTALETAEITDDMLEFYGNAKLQEANSLVGTGAVAFDGSGDYLLLDQASSWDIGTQDFTVDYWVNFDQTGRIHGMLGSSGGWSDGINIYRDESSYMIIHIMGQSYWIPWAASSNQWQHVALTREGTALRVFIDGSLIYTGTNSSSIQFSGNAEIGRYRSPNTYDIAGKIDEFRISKGIARWSTPFSPPLTQHTADEYTTLLLHFDTGEDPAILQAAADIDEIRSILLPRPLHDSLGDYFEIQSEFDTGDSIFFAKLAADEERGNIHEFNGNYFPEWDIARLNSDSYQMYPESGFASGITMPITRSALTDMNGDGLADRVYVDPDNRRWWVQLNQGGFFEEPVEWGGILGPQGAADYQSASIRSHEAYSMTMLNDLIDVNGDNLPDRVTLTPGQDGKWTVQYNNGTGFDFPVVLDANIQPVLVHSSSAGSKYGPENYGYLPNYQQGLMSTLIDMNGDGFPDRIVWPRLASGESPDHWYIQYGNETGFDDAVLWRGVDLDVQAWQSGEQKSALGWYERGSSSQTSLSSAAIHHWADYSFQETCVWMERNCRRWSDKIGEALNEIRQAFPQFNRFYSAYSNTSIGFDYRSETYQREMLQTYRDVTPKLLGDQSRIIDMNGDGLPDRVLIGETGAWHVQFNNGNGFDAAVLWAGSVRQLPEVIGARLASSIWLTEAYERNNVLVDLIDVTGDGRPDRVTVERGPRNGPGYSDVLNFAVNWWKNGANPSGRQQLLQMIESYERQEASHTWWVEVNNGQSFNAPAAWTGIYGNNVTETAITQNERVYGPSGYWPMQLDYKKTANLVDMNGDKIPDRVIYREGENRWLVQYGTGSGFLPVQEMQIESLTAPANQISTSRYDYLHVSLKSEENIPLSSGQVKVSLGNPEDSESYQEWWVSNLTTEWQNFYLPLDKTKTNAEEVKITFVPAAGNANAIPVYVEDMTFTALRPPAVKDWLDRFLAEEEVLAEIHSDRNQTLAEYLGFVESGSDSHAVSLSLLETLLNAETRLEFNQEGSLSEFETLYGAVSKVENGQITEILLPDGNKVEFGESSAGNSSMVRTITDSSGESMVQELSYGRVRQVTRSGKPPLHYSYEFDSLGREITVVFDPDTGVSERYRDIAGASRILSRTESTGVMTVFEYDESGDRVLSNVEYKGRVYETYRYGATKDGLTTLSTDSGVVEEYDTDGKIRYHTTADGYRYSHSFENARSVEMIMESESVTLPDGQIINFEIPEIELRDCVQGCESVHRVSLEGYTSEDGTEAVYQNGDLSSLKYSDGTRVFFSETRNEQVQDASTGDVVQEIHLMSALVVHPDGTSTEYQNGRPFALRRTNGEILSLETENGLLVNPHESASFHHREAEKLWETFVQPEWKSFLAPGGLALEMDYDEEGRLVTRRYAEGVTEIYEDGQILMTVGANGERLTHYEYDGEGNIIRVELEASRRRLTSAVLELKAEVAMERQKALAHLAEREQVLNQTIEGEYLLQQARLLEIKSKIENQKSKVASIKVKGKAAKAAISDANQQIQVGLDQVNAALERLAQNRIDALEQLSSQVQTASSEIEANTDASYEEIADQESLMRQAILRHETSPVIYHWYRKILGRDPAKSEYDLWISRTDYVSGVFDLEQLKADLLQGSELTARTDEVNFIKSSVTTDLRYYLSLTQSEREAFAAALGVPAGKLVSLSAAEGESILGWLNSRSLHFGQSAYVALESLLAQAGLSFERRELARRLILIDILTGTLTPIEQDDLLISLFAIKTVAAGYGLSGQGYGMTYESLKALYDQQCPQGVEDCEIRVIAHIDGNHYVVVTKVTDDEITFIETGSATPDHQDIHTMSKEEFLASWLDVKNPASQFGFIFSAQPPPAEEFSASRVQILDDSRLMSIRGAFFIELIVIAVIAVAKAVIAAVAATIAAISAIIGSIAAGIGSILSGFGSLFSGIFTGQFLAGLQGLFHGIVTGIGQIAGAVFKGIVTFGKTFADVYGLGGLTFKGLQASGAALLKTYAASSLAVGTSIGYGLQGVGKLLESMGLSSRFSQTLVAGGKIITGAVMVGSGNLAGLGFVSGGASELLSLHTNLSPVLSGIIGIGAAALTSFSVGFGDLSGLNALKFVALHLSMDLASSGLVALGDALNLDPRITSLVSVPVRAVVGSVVGGLFRGDGTIVGYRDDGTPIWVSNPGDLGDFINGAIQSAPTEISFDMDSRNAASEGGYTPNDINGSVVNQSGLFDKIFSSLKDAAISAKNFLGPVAIAATPSIIASFNQAQLNNGLSQTLNENVTVVFDRLTVENIFNTQGGIDAILAQGTTPVTLPDQTIVNGYKFSDTTTLLFDQNNEFIGQLKNGRYEIGEFSVTGNQEFAIQDGVILEDIGDGNTLRIEVADGKIGEVIVQDATTSPVVRIEGDTEPIFIKGPDKEVSFGNNFRIEFGPVQIGFELGKLKNVKINSSSQTPADSSSINEELYVLVNGIRNDELGEPGYLANLKADLVSTSNGQIGAEDVITAPTFLPLILSRLLPQLGFGANLVKDLILWAMEANNPLKRSLLSAEIIANIESYYALNGQEHRDRSIVGVGYSGGFAPLMETMIGQGYNATSLVALGAALNAKQMTEKVLDKILQAVDVMKNFQAGQVDFLKSVLNEVKTASSAIAGLTADVINDIASFVQSNLIENAMDLFKSKVESAFQAIPSFALGSLIGTSVDFVVNVWGSNDILEFFGIGGYQQDIGGITGADLLNIKIMGAEHDDYMRRPDGDTWNLTVSNFVAQIVRLSKSKAQVEELLNGSPFVQLQGDVWEVRLPGWDVQ